VLQLKAGKSTDISQSLAPNDVAGDERHMCFRRGARKEGLDEHASDRGTMTAAARILGTVAYIAGTASSAEIRAGAALYAGVLNANRQGDYSLTLRRKVGLPAPPKPGPGRSNATADFRCYFLDENGRIKAVQSFGCAAEAHAINLARFCFAEAKTFMGFELWQGERRIHSEGPVAFNAGTPWREVTPSPRKTRA
jgi:hypothetical protein